MSARAALLAPAGALAACSSTSGPKPAELTALPHGAEVRTLWRASVGDGGRFIFSPALAEGSVLAAARDGTVLRLDATSGRTQWSVSAGTWASARGGAGFCTAAAAVDGGR